jgi:cell wall-associated NlpC family hydrolase
MTAPSAIADVAAAQARVTTISTQVSVIYGAPVSKTASTTSAQLFASQLTAAASGTSTAGMSAAGMSTALTGLDGSLSSSSASGSAVVADAQRYLGVPYVFGDESSTGMDCSGLVQKTFGDLGISLPRTAAEQQQVGTPVASLADAQPGDLLFFGQPAYHVAIYAGNNQIIESPEPGKTVHEVPIYQQPTSISRIVGSPGVDPLGLSSTSQTAGGGLSASQLISAGINPAVAAYAPQFAAAEQQYGLPAGMLAAVAQQESGGNTQAISSAGAQGLMQLMPSTAAGMGVDAFDPSQAIQAAGKILSRNLGEFDSSVPLALAAYNAGAGAVQAYGGIPPYAQTQNYVRSITSMMAAGG